MPSSARAAAVRFASSSVAPPVKRPSAAAPTSAAAAGGRRGLEGGLRDGRAAGEPERAHDRVHRAGVASMPWKLCEPGLRRRPLISETARLRRRMAAVPT